MITSPQRFLTLVLTSSAVFYAGDRLAGQETAAAPILVEMQAKPVGVGVLLPSANQSAPEFQIAKRPWFWERFTETGAPPAAKQLGPPKPPLVADPSKMTPPSAVWTPPQPSSAVESLVVDPEPKQVDNDSEPQGGLGGGWTQRGSETINNEANDLPDGELIVGSGLPAEKDPGDRSRGKLEPATSVIRLLPVTADTLSESASESDDASVVILKAPISEETNGATQEPDSPTSGEMALNSETVTPQTNPTDKPEISSDTNVGRRIASSSEEPIPLRDPDDVAFQETEVIEANPIDAEKDAPVQFNMNDEDDSVAATEASPSEDAEDATDDLQSSRRKVVVREVRIKRDGSPSTENKSSRRRMATEETSEPKSASSQDLVTKKEVQVNTEPAPSAVKTVQVTPQLDYTGYPQVPLELTSSVRQMKPAMSQCLKYYFGRPESANVRSNWGMLHAIMVWGADTPILAGNDQYNAIAWIAGNNHCAGKPLLIHENGRMVATTGIGLQGHQAQFLAVLALCNVPLDYPLYVGDTRYTIDDLVKEEMLACRTGEELTFSLIGLSHYLDTDTRWTNVQGENWDLPRLLKEEMSQPIVGSACGGTHRLMGFAHALRKRRMEGREITEQWKRAEIYTDDFVQYAFKLQNRDGSMSTDWFEGREDNGSMDRKVQTTGHMVEWLLSVLPDSQLQNPRLVSAVRYLNNAMNRNRSHEWKIGPKGHALRALAMYYDRVYQDGPAWQSLILATEDAANRR